MTYGKETAYYSVGVYDRTLMAKNVAVGHYNIFFSLLVAQQKGLREMDLGSINVNNTEEKDRNIFKFKAGFATRMRSVNRKIAKIEAPMQAGTYNSNPVVAA